MSEDTKRLLDELARGRDAAFQLKSSLVSCKIDEGLISIIYSSFATTLYMLGSCGHSLEAGDSSVTVRTTGSSGNGDGAQPYVTNRRGTYKRKKLDESRSTETFDRVVDRYAWRKYGQKNILRSRYPRNYYRCTHKYDQNCQATKQEQQLSDSPARYRTTYFGKHTCSYGEDPSFPFESPSTDGQSFQILSFSANVSSPSPLTAITKQVSAYKNRPSFVGVTATDNKTSYCSDQGSRVSADDYPCDVSVFSSFKERSQSLHVDGAEYLISSFDEEDDVDRYIVDFSDSSLP